MVCPCSDFNKASRVILYLCTLKGVLSYSFVICQDMYMYNSFSDYKYETRPMQKTEICFGSKHENFQMKAFDIFIIFVQSIDCGYTLEPPR